jgi:formate hydrogenlyase subunit 3/multisubunit Na+/H+ antiporter MnhD subunit
MKKLNLSMHKNRVLSLLVGAGVKAGFLFAIAFTFFSFGLLPAVFLTAMGVFQLATAIIGGSSALVIQEAKKRISGT